MMTEVCHIPLLITTSCVSVVSFCLFVWVDISSNVESPILNMVTCLVGDLWSTLTVNVESTYLAAWLHLFLDLWPLLR